MLQRLYQGRTEETEVVVEVFHNLEEKQLKTLSEVIDSLMKERRQTTNVHE